MDRGATRQNLSGVGLGVSQGTDCERTNKEEARYRRGGTFAGKEGSGGGACRGSRAGEGTSGESRADARFPTPQPPSSKVPLWLRAPSERSR